MVDSHRPLDPAGEPILLTPRQAATLLAISERTVWTLTQRGELPCIRIGVAKRYLRSDLVAFVNNRRDETAGRKGGDA